MVARLGQLANIFCIRFVVSKPLLFNPENSDGGIYPVNNELLEKVLPNCLVPTFVIPENKLSGIDVIRQPKNVASKRLFAEPVIVWNNSGGIDVKPDCLNVFWNIAAAEP